MCPACEWDVREINSIQSSNAMHCIKQTIRFGWFLLQFSMQYAGHVHCIKKTRKTIQTCAGQTKACTVCAATLKSMHNLIRFTVLPVKCPTFYYMLPWTRNTCKRIYDNVFYFKTFHMKRFMKRFIWSVFQCNMSSTCFAGKRFTWNVSYKAHQRVFQ